MQFNLQAELIDRSELCQALGDYAGAEKLIKRAIKLNKEEHEDDTLVKRFLVRKLSNNYVLAGQFDRADRLWKRLIKSLRDADEEEREIANTLVQMALFYMSHDRLRAAQIRFNQALAIQKPNFSKDYPDYVLTVSEIGRLHAIKNKRKKAEQCFSEALELAEEVLGPWHEFVALVLRRRALSLTDRANPEHIEPLLERAVAILADDRAKPHPELRKCLLELGDLSIERGYIRRAEKLYVKSLQLTEPFLGSKHKDSLKLLKRLADLRRSMRKYEEAESHYRKIVTILRQTGERRSPEIARALYDLGAMLRESHEYDKSEPILKEALAIQELLLKEDDKDIAATLYELGALHQETNKFSIAEDEFRRSLEIRKKAKRQSPLAVADLLTGLALVHFAKRQHKSAEELLLEALSLKEEVLGTEAPQLVETLNKLGRICENQLKTEAAVEYYERANAIEHQQHGFFCRIWLDYDE